MLRGLACAFVASKKRSRNISGGPVKSPAKFRNLATAGPMIWWTSTRPCENGPLKKSRGQGDRNRRILNLCSGDNRPFEPLGDSRDGIPNHTYSVSVAATGENLEELGTKGIPMNAIEVKTSWENRRAGL